MLRESEILRCQPMNLPYFPLPAGNGIDDYRPLITDEQIQKTETNGIGLGHSDLRVFDFPLQNLSNPIPDTIIAQNRVAQT